MTDTLPLADQLKQQAALALSKIAGVDTRFMAKAGDLDLLIHNAEAREHRRAAHLARDGKCYRLGSAFEPIGGLDLDPVALTGWLSCGTAGLLLLVREAVADPSASIAANLSVLFRSPAGRLLRDRGVWVRWHWLRDLYKQEVTDFLATPAGRDPEARWRTKRPSARQTYIVAQICEALQLEHQSLATRGEAFKWILGHEGNPRFQTEPPKPDLAALLEVVR